MTRVWLRGAIGCLTTAAMTVVLAAGQDRVIPGPAQDIAPGKAAAEVALFAGGCFWGVQGVFQHVKGVTTAVSGFAGFASPAGPAETVQVTFDPREVSYGTLLHIFFSVAHDPTQINRQGPDVGPEYRSALFPTTPDQSRIARAYLAQLTRAKVFPSFITTTLESDTAFRVAPPEHQDYLTRHPTDPYIVINDLPKLEALRRRFPQFYRSKQ